MSTIQPAWGYNDGIKNYNKVWTTVSRKGSICDLSHFLKLLDSDLVRAAVARTTIRLSKPVDVKWSTIFN